MPRVLLAAALFAAHTLAHAVQPGQQAPDIFGRSLLEDRKYRVSDFRGKVLIVDFWASWCGPCVISMPELEALRTRMRAMGHGERFEVLGVNLDDDTDRALAFLKLHPVTYPVIADLLGLGTREFEPRKLPSAYVIGPTGRVNFIYYGYGKGYGAELEQRVLEELKAQPDPR
jgi:thiol-disulfide isomerase/thioredoxin